MGQDYNQTCARTTVELRFFSCPFSLQTQENKQKMVGNNPFFLCAKPRLRETLVIFPSEVIILCQIKNLLMPHFLMGCVPGDFQEGKRPIKACAETAH